MPSDGSVEASAVRKVYEYAQARFQEAYMKNDTAGCAYYNAYLNGIEVVAREMGVAL